MGHIKVEKVCVDMCEGINCGIGGNCLSGNCTCETGYTNVENYCEETCALIPCQELIEIQQNLEIFSYLFINLFSFKQKNEGMCFDDEGSRKFSCTCTPRYFGERCEDDRCDIYQCQNNGTCIVTLINDIPTPACECTGNYGGATCNVDLCLDIECGNGTCIVGNCQCDEGYVNDGNICVEICNTINCGIGGYCSQGICSCGEGFKNVGDICVDMCEGVDCGIGEECLNGNCTCQTGYTNVTNICEETCALSPCKELIEI